MKVKTFVIVGREEFEEKEELINKWLETKKDEIEILDKQIQSAASEWGHALYIVFFYTEK